MSTVDTIVFCYSCNSRSFICRLVTISWGMICFSSWGYFCSRRKTRSFHTLISCKRLWKRRSLDFLNFFCSLWRCRNRLANAPSFQSWEWGDFKYAFLPVFEKFIVGYESSTVVDVIQRKHTVLKLPVCYIPIFHFCSKSKPYVLSTYLRLEFFNSPFQKLFNSKISFLLEWKCRIGVRKTGLDSLPSLFMPLHRLWSTYKSLSNIH